MNYLRLYPALVNIHFQLEKLSFLRGPSSNLSSLTAQISVSNPTDYSGFRLGSVSLTSYFYLRSNTNNTLFTGPNLLRAAETLLSQLGPNSAVSLSLPIGLTAGEASQLSSFNATHYGDVLANVQLRVDILTFLEAATGSVPFTRAQDVPLSSN